jgi:nijmegen breakage syndrome protein 1
MFGRVAITEGAGFQISDKTISRKHLVIEVSQVPDGDGSRLNHNSKVTIQDLGTKIGTWLDGVQMRGQTVVLNGESHSIKLGHYAKLFKVFWHPVVLTFSFSGKELRQNLQQEFLRRLEPFDIKVLTDYVRDFTTHVVANKRNTTKGLQGLINGKYIVNRSFVDAIEVVAKHEGESDSALEQDFDGSWPKELEHLPPKGVKEGDHPNSDYEPNAARQKIFDGYTFIFYDEGQFNNLLAPITNGKGNALYREVIPDKTTPEEFAAYVKSVAGEKGLGAFGDGSEGKGVVVVGYGGADTPTEYYANFRERVALLLDHRVIVQSEFLPAILRLNAASLRRPLENVVTPEPAQPAPSPVPAVAEQPQREDTQRNETQASARSRLRTRRGVASRFRGFEDEFGELKEENKETKSAEPESQGMFVRDDTQPTQQSTLQSPRTRLSQRRALSRESESQTHPQTRQLRSIVEDSEEERNVLDDLAPAAMELKRLRLADPQAAQRFQAAESARTKELERAAAVIAAKPEKTRKEIDILEVAKKRREEQDEKAKLEREELNEAMEDIHAEEVRQKIVVQSMDIHHTTASRAQHQQSNPRWDPKWTGRPNFKKFRRKGEGQRGLNLADKIIVPLQVVNKRDTITQDDWLENDSGRRSGRGRTESQRTVGTESQIRRRDTNESSATATSSQPRTTGPTPTSASSTRQTQSERVASGEKRPASETMSNPASSKRPRTISPPDDSDDSDDGLAFKFRKR